MPSSAGGEPTAAPSQGVGVGCTHRLRDLPELGIVRACLCAPQPLRRPAGDGARRLSLVVAEAELQRALGGLTDMKLLD